MVTHVLMELLTTRTVLALSIQYIRHIISGCIVYLDRGFLSSLLSYCILLCASLIRPYSRPCDTSPRAIDQTQFPSFWAPQCPSRK
ncbi:hypothetical protein B0T21DRAFT_373624 [Apiosordaria backusii]|uniref:Uncharacterized protein n=1 Tax=Apiosordaria backusii TaxID=314023 RepID=A0AA40ASZ3_9PEZI|nr:hypothetical protein B0T21DRAFT_373624 [Apiosordaria backusii]